MTICAKKMNDILYDICKRYFQMTSHLTNQKKKVE